MDIDNFALQAALVAGVFVVLYLYLVRPQQKRLRKHREMIESLRPGDRVTTAGGLVGTIVSVHDAATVTIEVSRNTDVVVMRTKIDRVLSQAGSKVAEVEAAEERPMSA